jgi:hypothetical protein
MLMSKVFYRSKTLLASAALVVAGLADVAGAVDLKSAFSLVGVPEDKVGGTVALVSLGFGLLRLVTKGPVAAKAKEDDE